MSDAEAEVIDPPTGVDALHALRAARRANERAQIDWFEAVYRVYLTGFLGVFVTLLAASLLGDQRVSAAGLADVRAHGPAAAGALAAVALAIGLRSGSRGGPLAVERADVTHVLLAPIDRRRALIGPAIRQLRYGAFVGVLAGAVVGELTHRRLGGNAAAWVGCGAAFGVLVILLSLTTAAVTSGLRIRRWIATVLALVVLVWAAADVAGTVPAPTTVFGSLALWPLRVHLIDLTAVAAVAALLVVGLRTVGRVSLEQAERRTGLVGQLRFAVTMQDLRTVLVLRRQLAQDLPRSRPYLKMGFGRRWPVFRRGMRGLMRFPGARLARMAVLGIAAGIALRGVYAGNGALLVLAALALYVAALDAMDPLSQEVDQSDRADAVPTERGSLHARHLPAVAIAMTLVGLVGATAVVVLDRTRLSLELAAIVWLPASFAAAAGAVVSVVMGAPEPARDGSLMPPEFAGMKLVARTAWPLVLAVIGTLPVLAAQRATLDGHDPRPATAQVALFVLIVAALAGGWVRFRDEIHAWWRRTLEEGQKAQKERLAGRRPAAGTASSGSRAVKTAPPPAAATGRSRAQPPKRAQPPAARTPSRRVTPPKAKPKGKKK
ncbi:MAG: hypothetical protein QOD72_3960 [Acidimicrobiaceae bacterium]|nr:hypothetical protein [Acidimicrobiaceae bacterium]